MLLRFSFSNFLSFKDLATIDFTAEGLKEKREYLHIPYFYNPGLSLLKSLCIYGHNSHGKSNVIKAYSFFQKFILTSFGFSTKLEEIEIDQFNLNTESIGKPSYFESVIILKETKYRYGFKLTKEKIIEEWLYYSDSKIRENVLFHRYEQEFKEIGKIWNKESNNRVELVKSFTKSKNLFLSVLLNQDNIPRITSIHNWFEGNQIISNSNFENQLSSKSGAIDIYSKLEYRDVILKFIKNADLGFTTIFDKINFAINRGRNPELINAMYEKEQKAFELYSIHDVFNEKYKKVTTIEFLLHKNESSGTIKYFIISCLLTKAIKDGQLILIDELDSSLHNDLLMMIIKIFNDPKNNSTGAQLIFSTHNTVLLNKQLRRDQIHFVKKNEYGESTIEPMHSTEHPIRIGKSVEEEYRTGKLKNGVSDKIKRDDTPTLFK